MTKRTSWTVQVQEDPETQDAIIEFPDDLLEQVGWVAGDIIEWKVNSDGSCVLSKKDLTNKDQPELI
jgi:hypothetical protein